MTAAERERLLERLQNLLGEHCEAFAICVEVDEGPDDTLTMHTWGGGYNRALGLAHRMVRRMEDSDRDANNAPPDEGEEWKGVPV